MSSTSEGTGSCLCGAVRFTAKNMSKNAGACHCRQCRQWGGGPFISIDCGSDVEFEGQQSISIFDSSAWADRGFCNKCGSHLFYRLKGNKQYMLPAGLFDDDTNLVLDHQVFIDEKPSFYSFSNKTTNMTGAEIFAKYATPSE